MFKNTYFEKDLRTAASIPLLLIAFPVVSWFSANISLLILLENFFANKKYNRYDLRQAD